jgi:hypothetical protein
MHRRAACSGPIDEWHLLLVNAFRHLAFEFGAEQVREQLKGVEAMELTEDDARQRLDALLAALKEHKEALVLAGFAWPGEGIGAMREMEVPPNPFMLTANGKHLQSLRERLGPPNP